MFNYLSAYSGFIVTLQVVDGSPDTLSIVSLSRAATDCSPPGQGEFVNTYQLISGDITVVDAQPPQAPPNDTFEHATQISSLPFSQVLDTTQATIDSTDLEALAACGGPSITGAATVWYEYTPPVDQSVLILTGPVPPSYGAGVAVLTGSPGSLSAVTCFPSLGSFSATAGVTYHIVVADISGGSGGELHFSVSTPGVEIKVDRFGRFDPKTGVATATGTFTCPSGLSGQISGDLSQRTTFASTAPIPSTSPATALPSPGRSHSRRLPSSRAAPPTYRWPSASLASPAGASATSSTKGSSCAVRRRAEGAQQEKPPLFGR